MTTLVTGTAHIGGILAALGRYFAMFSAAVQASNAVQSGRRPSADVLEKLGLSQDAFSDHAA